MMVVVKPDDPNFVVIGGTSLYRSTDGFASTASTSHIGGYGTTLPNLSLYPGSHPDMHNLAFNPANFKEAISANDGGVQATFDITAQNSAQAPVAWIMASRYQTLQFYYVGMDPEAGRNNFLGGAQDNGSIFRDGTRLFDTPVADSNNQISVFGGDGTSVGFAKVGTNEQLVYTAFQYGHIYRQKFSQSPSNTNIIPQGATAIAVDQPDDFGEFITVFRLDPDNTEDLYYVNFNRLFRTTSASTVTPTTWTEIFGVASTLSSTGNNNIRSLALSRGPYTTNHALYMGTTRSKIYRLDNPRNAAINQAPIDITPAGLSGIVQDISTNPNNDDEVIAVVSNYGTVSIWWTNNGKSAVPTWRNAEGNLTLPSLRSCMITVKKDASNNPVTEYYVGTSVGLFSVANLSQTLLANGSPTWQREGESVINFAVGQSLAYRPVDNVLLLGTHGNGMYFTNLGTPNFSPNLNTAIDPVTNDKNFIQQVFPTFTSNNIQYRTGNMFGIKKIDIQLFNLTGQQIFRKQSNYQNGMIDFMRYARGNYILQITSDDLKYRHIQKIIKQ
jgi:hypothetical protein